MTARTALSRSLLKGGTGAGDLLKRVAVWRSLLPSTSTDLSHGLILGILCVHLAEQRGILVAGSLRMGRSQPGVHAYLCQLLQRLAALSLPIPPAWSTPALFLEDEILAPIWADLEAIPSDSYTPVEVLGQVHEGFLAQPQGISVRKSGGMYYTPLAIADYMVDQTVGVWLKDGTRPQVLDPACGGGIFLLRAYQRLLDGWQHPSWVERSQCLLDCIYGVDIDPQAIEVTKIALLFKLLESPDLPRSPLPDLSRNVRCGNAVIGVDFMTQFSHSTSLQAAPAAFSWEEAFPAVIRSGGFEVVIGNPPYVDAEGMTAHVPEWRSYCVRHYRTARGNWDLFCVFIEKALSLCKSGGLTSLIVPNKLISANYAATARSLLARENQLLVIRDYSRLPVFAVSVYPVVFVVRKGLSGDKASVRYEEMAIDTPSQLPTIARTRLLAHDHFASGQSWLLATTPPQLALITRLRQLPTLATMAEVTGAATVAEAYALQSLIQEHSAIEPGDLRLVNSGTIDRYHMQWGEKPLRYLGATYQHPIVPRALVAHLPKNRYRQAVQPKLMLAGMVRQLECAVDLNGSILAGKSTTVVRGSIDLRYLLGLLNSRLVDWFFSQNFGGNRLQGGYLRVGAPQLRQIPMPVLHLADRGDRQRYEQLLDAVDQMLSLQVACQAASISLSEHQVLLEQISEMDQQIDRLVYQLYRLSDRDVALLGCLAL